MTSCADVLCEQYASMVERLGPRPATGELSRALVHEGDWTPEGADTVLRLAREYGTFVLRNALALATALGIEDGSAGV